MTSKVTNACLLIGREMVPDWFADAVRILLEDTGTEIELVVITENIKSLEGSEEVQQRSKLEQLKRRLLTPSFLNRSPVEHTSLNELDILTNTERIEIDLEPADPIGVKIPEDAVDVIGDRCDVVIHNGVGILQGDILTRPEHGVLSYHHGDIREYRGGAPAGFWQHLNDEKHAGITLQRLNEELDAGEIVELSKVSIDDADTWHEVQERMYSASIPMLKEGIRTINDPDEEIKTVPESELGEMYYRSDWTVWARIRSQIKDRLNSYL